MEESLDNPRRITEIQTDREDPLFRQQPGTMGVVDRRKTDTRTLFLAGMTGMLFETLDADQLVINVVTKANAELGSWAIIDSLDDAGAVHRLAVIHPDPAVETLGRELRQRYPPVPTDIFGVHRIMKTQQPELVREIADETMHSENADRRQTGLLQALGFSSLMIVPLKGRDRLLGAITFMGAEDHHRFTPKDLLFAEDLAGRVAMAMDNARLHHEAKSAR
ncbi:MAG: GAF domain-containing protein, partial [Gemmatimonadaceae bacterium]